MSVLRRAKLRTPDGAESIEYPLGVDAENVEVANGENLSQRLARIDEDLEKNEEDIAAVSELAGTNKQNIGANEIRIDALERRSISVDKKPYYFDTVADMKAYQGLIEGDMVITLGYYEANDGGSGTYKIVDNSYLEDDGGSIHNLDNGLKAELIIKDNQINVKQFGAYGNGINDDTEKIQKAIDLFNNILFINGQFLLSDSVNLKNDLNICGKNSTIITNSNKTLFKAKGNTAVTSIFRYTATEEKEEQSYYIIYNDKYYSFNTPALSINDVLDINIISLICVCNNSGTEKEIKIVEYQTVPSGTNITENCVQSSKEVVSGYIENITIDGLNFYNENYENNNQNIYAFDFTNIKNIEIKNCKCTYMGLATFNTTCNIGSSTKDIDVYTQAGLNLSSLSSNINVHDNEIIGLKKDNITSITTTTSGIYMSYIRNSSFNNNTIKYMVHGISVWGGNVGTVYYNTYNMLKFCNDLIFTNNDISNVHDGGIWTSRSGNILVNNNIIKICGDVGIDFEGSSDCVADGNNVCDCKNGCLANFHYAHDITYSNNVVEDNSILTKSTLVYNHSNSTLENVFREIRINYLSNLFISKYKFCYINHSSSMFGLFNYKNNSFINCGIAGDNNDNPTVCIENNSFKINENAISFLINRDDGKRGIIYFTPNNRDGGTIAYIVGNTFDVLTGINNNKQTPGNNALFDGIYAISFYGSKYNRPGSIMISDNKILGLSNSISLKHVASANSSLYMYLYRNLVSGSIDNLSENTTGFIIYDNNKCLKNKNASNYRITSDYYNIPNVIPSETTTGAYKQGTRIYFDIPDSDGYTGAICIADGNPGTWKRFGKIES